MAAVNRGGGRLKGPPLPAVLVMVAGPVMGIAAAELRRSVAMRLSLWWIIVAVVVGFFFLYRPLRYRLFGAGNESAEKFSSKSGLDNRTSTIILV